MIHPMKTAFIRFISRYSAAAGSLLLLLILFNAAVAWAASGEKRYVGAKRCGTCHAKEYGEWKHSGHARILRKASDPEVRNIPLPAGYTRKNISYVIGGFRWKALFLDRDGYLVTSTPKGIGKNQYNLKDEKWVDYLPGQKIPYDCGGCHTTGYSAQGRQNGLKGIIGTWKGEGIQCEACHGPGSAHVASTLKADINVDRSVCSRCHESKPVETVRVRDGFLTPYSEVNQLMKSTMRHLACIDCHDPHPSAEHSIKQTCEGCHQRIARSFNTSFMNRVGVTCMDCHMAPAGVVAEGDRKKYRGDLKSHIFKIERAKEFPDKAVNGHRINPGYLSVEYACLRCHDLFEDRKWAVLYAPSAHKIKVTNNIKIMRFQTVSTSIGFLFAIAALLSALSLKNLLWPLSNKQIMLSIHKHSVWITFSVYVFISFSCIYFHFPLEQPSHALNLGWFIIHMISGALGLVLYGGKIITVRIYKKGWAYQGVLWGAALFIFWLIQYITVLLHFFNLLEV